MTVLNPDLVMTAEERVARHARACANVARWLGAAGGEACVGEPYLRAAAFGLRALREDARRAEAELRAAPLLPKLRPPTTGGTP